MAGELIYAYGTRKVLEAAGGALANAAAPAKATNAYDVVTDGAGFPDAVFALTMTFGSAPSENVPVLIYARPMLVDGVNHADVPEITRPGRVIAHLAVNNTLQQTLEVPAFDLPKNAEYYLHNASGVSITAWALSVVPRTYKAA